MYFHLHRNSKKWTFYSVKILKCEYFYPLYEKILKVDFLSCNNIKCEYF